MAEKTLEKVTLVRSEDGQGYRIAVSYMTGGNGREASLLPDVYETEDEAAAQARARFGVDPDPADQSIARRP